MHINYILCGGTYPDMSQLMCCGCGIAAVGGRGDRFQVTLGFCLTFSEIELSDMELATVVKLREEERRQTGNV